MGECDAFVSHSWHDDAAAKWQALQVWREQFKKRHKGREPKLWIDKYCIDQNSIKDSLACLPVFLAGSRRLLVLCGETYLERLWCLIEIMVFIEMGGNVAELNVELLKDAKTARKTRAPRQSVVPEILQFDPRDAKCFTEYDTLRLQAVLEITGHDRIAAVVRQALQTRLA
jgi:hypothetical protein